MTTHRTGHILIVGGAATDRDQIAQYLTQAGHTFTSADNGRQALAMLLLRKFDLVLLDILLPERGAFQLLEKLKADQGLRLLPVLITSPQEETEAIGQGLEAGAADCLTKPFNQALFRARIAAALEKAWLREQDQMIVQQLAREKKHADTLLQMVIPLGAALSAEKDFDRLLELILLDAKLICNADGGTLYLRTPDDHLKFEILRNDTLNLALGGTTGRPVTFAPLPLYDKTTGEPNHHNVATHTALTAVPVNIADAYQTEGFDFSGTRAFDRANGYRSKSFLTIPLKNQSNAIIGVLQLINARDPDSGDVIAFDQAVQRMVESLSMLATVALEAYLREQHLKEQIRQLQIVIDETRKSAQVAEITETEYFHNLQKKAKALRASHDR